MNSHYEIRYRLDIQGLRAVAIAIVVLAHANVPGFAGGFVGVDVFFVLSGFLITGLLVQERLNTGTIRYGKFLARRLRRLLPALLVMLLAVLLLAPTLLSTYEAEMQTGAFVFATTWTSNFYFALAEFDYFAALKAKDLFLHTWSLGIEEQFYVVWPLLTALSFFVTAGRGGSDRGIKSFLAVIAIVFISSLALCLYWAQTKPLLSFYMMPSRGWQFALGASVFVCSNRRRNEQSNASDFLLSNTVRQLTGALGLFLILGSAVMLHAKLTYPGYLALFPSVGAALLILSGAGSGPCIVNHVLASRVFVWLGDRSYSLYLWHWPVLLLGGAYSLTNHSAGIVSLVVISILLAMLSYHLIERPFWKGRFSAAPPRLVALTSALAMAVAVGLAQSLGGVVYADLENSGMSDARLDAPTVFVPGTSCDSWYFSADVVPCGIGDSDARHTAVLMGDSIGAQWASFLPEIYTTPDWQVLVLTKSACAIVDVEYYYGPVGGLYEVCTKWRNASIEYLEELKPDIVFIGSSSGQSFSEAQWVGGTERVIMELAAAARYVVTIPGTPALSFDAPSCLREPYRFTSRLRDSKYICEEAMTNTASVVLEYLEQAASIVPNAHVLNLNDLVCPKGRCAARSKGGITVFRDSQHLTASFVLAQVSEVLNRLNSIGVGPSMFEKDVELASKN